MKKNNPLWSYMKEHMGVCVSLRDSHLCLWGPPPLCCRGRPTWKWLGCMESEITGGKKPPRLDPSSVYSVHSHTNTRTHNLTQKPTRRTHTQSRGKQADAWRPLRPSKAARLRRRLLCWDKAAVWLPSCRSRVEWGRGCKFLRKSC